LRNWHRRIAVCIFRDVFDVKMVNMGTFALLATMVESLTLAYKN